MNLHHRHHFHKSRAAYMPTVVDRSHFICAECEATLDSPCPHESAQRFVTLARHVRTMKERLALAEGALDSLRRSAATSWEKRRGRPVKVGDRVVHVASGYVGTVVLVDADAGLVWEGSFEKLPLRELGHWREWWTHEDGSAIASPESTRLPSLHDDSSSEGSADEK